MRGLLALLLGLLLPVLAGAQDAKTTPIVQAEYAATSAVPGQPLVMRLKILVPTWMPKPPVLPTYDLPNIMVRTDGRASTSISEQIDGETWSGISRKYLIFPLVAGEIQIPAQTVVVQYADPETRDPIKFEATVEATSLTGAVPEGAGDLDPFIAATGLEIEQSFEGEPTDLAPGDALVRRIIVRIKGTSPMVLPPLIDTKAPPGLAVYADEPVLDEKQDRGVLSGSRTERITYVAEGGGRFAQPAVALRWFNLDTGQIETAEIAGFEITASGSPPTAEEPVDWRRIVADLAPIVLGLIALGILAWRLWPRLARWRARRRAAYLASEGYAYRQVLHQVEKRQIDGTMRSVRQWWRLAAPGASDLPEPLQAALANIGAATYGRAVSGGVDGDAWRGVRRALDDTRKSAAQIAEHRRGAALPPLNPLSGHVG